jgi:hypothetical protein
VKPAYVYDIETENWTTFVIGALYDGKNVEIFDHRKEREFAARLLTLTGEVYAHNGGRFDHLWLLDAAYRFGLNRHAHVMENSTGIIYLDFGTVKFLDSYRLFPLSLRKLTNGAKRSLSDLCKCGKDCGGYCAITRAMPAPIRARVTDYLIADVRELWDALGHFQRVASECGISLGITIGGTAWKSASKELGLDPQPYDDNVNQWRFVRQGYFGGRVELFRTQAAQGYQYDVNSMYPAKIATVPLPLDFKGKVFGRAASAAYSNSIPGIYRASVTVPDYFIPPLPYRSEKGRILYPTGKICGTWALPELEYAESLGARVEYVSEAAIFKRSAIIFEPWVTRLFNVRMKYGKDSREGAWLKWILNSLTGKFGTKVTQRSYFIDPCFNKNCKLKECRKTSGHGLNCCGNPATSRVWYSEFERIQHCAHVEWAAYLTAHARITLHKGLTEGNQDDAIYCDTDSVFAKCERRNNVGNGLGQWHFEGRFDNFVALAPKVYFYHLCTKQSPTLKAKGIPLPDFTKRNAPLPKDFWQSLTKGKPINYWSVAGIRNPVDGLFFVRRHVSRHVNRNFGGRVPHVGERTRPPHAKEIESLFGAAHGPDARKRA